MNFEKRENFWRIWEICVVLCVFVLECIVIIFPYFRFKALFRLSKAFLVHLWYSCSFLFRKCLRGLKNWHFFEIDGVNVFLCVCFFFFIVSVLRYYDYGLCFLCFCFLVFFFVYMFFLLFFIFIFYILYILYIIVR